MLVSGLVLAIDVSMDSANEIAPLNGTQIQNRIKVRDHLTQLVHAATARCRLAMDDDSLEPIAVRNLVESLSKVFDMWAQITLLPVRPKGIGGKAVLEVEEAHVVDNVKEIVNNN